MKRKVIAAAALTCVCAGMAVMAAPEQAKTVAGSSTQGAGAVATTATQAAGPVYGVTKVIKPEDDGRYWNFGITIDAQGKYMYLLEGQYTLIAEAATGKKVGFISTCWSNGIALAPQAGRGFISTGQWGVIVFDLKTHAEIGKLDLQAALGGAIYDPICNRVLVAKAPWNVLVPIAPDIDLKTGKPEEPIKFQGEVRGMVSDGRGTVYVTVTGNDDITEHVAVLDTRKMQIMATWEIPAGVSQATGISVDAQRSRLFVSCAGKLLIMSATDGHVLAVVPVGNVSGGWVGYGTTAFADGKVYASCGDRTFTVVGQNAEGKFEVERQLEGVGGVTAFAVHPETGEVYVPTMDDANPKQPPGFKIIVVGKK